NRTVFFGGDPDLPGQIAAAAEAGFRLFGPDTFSLDAWTAASKPVEELAERLEAAGMRCFEIAALDVGEEGPTLEQARHVAEMAPLELVAYVQFDDALPMVSDYLVAETCERRVFPGEGEFDLEGYCTRMRAKGFDGVVSVEILNAEWRTGDLREYARRCYGSSARYW